MELIHSALIVRFKCRLRTRNASVFEPRSHVSPWQRKTRLKSDMLRCTRTLSGGTRSRLLQQNTRNLEYFLLLLHVKWSCQGQNNCTRKLISSQLYLNTTVSFSVILWIVLVLIGKYFSLHLTHCIHSCYYTNHRQQGAARASRALLKGPHWPW